MSRLDNYYLVCKGCGGVNGHYDECTIENYSPALELRQAQAELAEANIYKKYVQIEGVGPTYCLHGSSSIAAFEALEQQLAEAKEDRRMALIDEQHLVDAEIEIKELKKELQQVKSEYQRMSERYAAVLVDKSELLTILDSYKQGVEVETVATLSDSGTRAEVWLDELPSELIGQRVKVLVRAIGSIAERADLRIRELKDSESAKIESKLRILAQATLRGHDGSCCFCPLESADCNYIVDKYCCQCEACTLAREVWK